MKKTIEKEVFFCDRCAQETGWVSRCLICGEEMCYECGKKYGISYQEGVHHSGSSDGFYCMTCDMICRQTLDNPLHSGYLKIQELRKDEYAWRDSFRRQCTKVESSLKQLLTEPK